MQPGQILRDSWRITWRCWPLWLLNLLMLVTVVPTAALSGAFGGAAGFLSVPVPVAYLPEPMARLRQIPGWIWILAALATLVVLVITSAVSWMFQAGAMRGAALASDKGNCSLRECLTLGRRRVFSLIRLSAAYSLLVGAIGILPPMLMLVLARWLPSASGLLQLSQTVLAPLTTVLSLALLLVMMSVALEDLAPRAAARRAWLVFRKAWWGFLLVWALSTLPALGIVLVLLPFIVLVPAAIIWPGTATYALTGLCGCLSAPVGLGLILFTAVFTLVLYTLIYRAASGALPRETA